MMDFIKLIISTMTMIINRLHTTLTMELDLIYVIYIIDSTLSCKNGTIIQWILLLM
ncbi:hypothetical protein HanRHA438_Chr05g0214081 [Helianthus annuus]|nr:hypothetical protein HanHA300_Chr05g0167731 [Helianthus annuus]KAJ0583881.1 hypothetical protein HanHA89_Chr05g0181801 [Helianthus annuus]KAJ0918129.1 hypothetical protein HanRHA438_Chr05g0214081 [Helianthus annuus]KAJ0921888.1 hypothetical protein HanPSC8_Chr05g0196991 [Helianthus annuus]